MADSFQDRCSCEDCEAAVSPGAYLASLLDYTLKHVLGDGPIDIPFLEARFHQPFSSLPLDCSATSVKVHQARLAVETLRSYLGARPLFDSLLEKSLADAEASYRLTAYVELLTQNGVDYEDIRRARTAKPGDRAALASRLGIRLTTTAAVPRRDELDRLYLDPLVPLSDPNGLSERALEALFGLGDTERNRLSTGVKFGDAQNQITEWSFAGVSWNQNTDVEGRVHLSIVKSAPDAFNVFVYSDPERTKPVASGELETGQGSLRLVPANASGLSGTIALDYKTDDLVNLSVALTPSLLIWRMAHLRDLWSREDWPETPPAPDALPSPPLIDPQVIGLDDLRNPRPGDAAFDFWLSRTQWLEDRRSALQSAREAAADGLSGFAAIVSQSLSLDGSVGAPKLDELDALQKKGERIGQRLQSLGLEAGSFAFLTSLLAILRDGQTVLDAEWSLAYATLTDARKRLQYAQWRLEERTAGLTLSPDHFQSNGDLANAPASSVGIDGPLWLSTRNLRRAWSDVLEARLGQDSETATALSGAVSQVEETALPLLRTALIAATDAPGATPEERAKWLTKWLLIDFLNAGTLVTTRDAQAIESLQELLFSLRTGQLAQNSLSSSAPLISICAAAQGERRIDLIGRGEDDLLWRRVWDGAWRSWRAIGRIPGKGSSGFSGGSGGDPIALTHQDGTLSLLIRGSDSHLWFRPFEHNTWRDWRRVDTDADLAASPAGALDITFNPAGVILASGQIQAFAAHRGDQTLLTRAGDGVTWSAWDSSLGTTAPTSPAVVSWDGTRIDLFLAATTADPTHMTHLWREGGAWQTELIDGLFPYASAAVSRDTDKIDLFQNRSGHLWRKSWEGAWNSWVDLDAGVAPPQPKINGIPAVVSVATNALDVFALRNGKIWRRAFRAGAWEEWALVPSDTLTLDAPDFDVEWKWIGSYATWRSPVFVTLYPENLLLPSLVTRSTPAFRELAEQSRPTKRLQPEDACKLAQTYSNYLRDVNSLTIEATCIALTDLAAGDPCKTAATVRRPLSYMFGVTTSGKVYWSAIDSADRSGYGQTFWEQAPLTPKDAKDDSPPFKVTHIVGALPWMDAGLNQHHIYLFLLIEDPSGRKLKRARFDTRRYGRDDAWEGGLIEISDMPTFIEPGTGAEKQIPVNRLTILPVQSDRATDPPRLALHAPLHTFNLYVRELNANADGWSDKYGELWATYQIEPRFSRNGFVTPERVNEVEAALSVGNSLWIVYGHRDLPDSYHPSPVESRRVYLKEAPAGAWNVGEYPAQFRGALPGDPFDPSIFLFYDEDGQTIYRKFRKSAGPGPAMIPSPSIKGLATHSGSAPNFFVAPKKAGHSYAFQCKDVSGELIGSSKLDVVPVLSSIVNIPSGGAQLALQGRAYSIKGVYQQNQGSSATILAYLVEAYRLVPWQLGLCMQSSGEYVAALDWFSTVYDYRAAQGERFIDYGLVLDSSLAETGVYQNADDWLLDPLNPHSIAATRRYAYTRYAIATIVRCLNDFADSEFTNDTPESLVRARLLSETALALCDAPEMKQHLGTCEAVIAALKIQPGADVSPEVAAALGQIAEELTQGQVSSGPLGKVTFDKLKTLIGSGKSYAQLLPELTEIKNNALATASTTFTTGAAVADRPAVLTKAYSGLLTDFAVEKAIKSAATTAVASASEWITNAKLTSSLGSALPGGGGGGAPVLPAGIPMTILSAPGSPVALPSFQFCIPPNPTFAALRSHAELTLRKLRTGRNIAGIQREIPAYAAATDTVTGMPVIVNGQLSLPGGGTARPTVYRYSVLIARAKELAQQAAQVEAQFLSAARMRDEASFTLQKARQELALTQSQVRLQNLRLTEATHGVGLAQLQEERAGLQFSTYQQWISAGPSEYEEAMLTGYLQLEDAKTNAGAASAAAQIAQAAVTAATASVGGAAAAMGAGAVAIAALAGAGFNALVATAEANIGIASLQASYERRVEDWQLQSLIAMQDSKIGKQQIVLAQDETQIVQQEVSIAETQQSQARDTIEFLSNQFTGFELFDWMSGALSDVYRSLLQQATSMAKVAQSQLAFERQEAPPAIIRSDYWVAPSSNPLAQTSSNSDGREGLTGSERLIGDIYQLDQYAFNTNKRKLAITKTFSLAQMAPAEFQKFRETGVIAFNTPMEAYDRDFPGHYLRLIRRVRVSVIALIPPTDGIHATLASTGISRVVIGPETFQTVTIRRDPEIVALTAPIGSSGVFEMDYSNEMYLPFEGNGVDGGWELRMPRASNRYNFQTLSDVLVSFDVFALNSFDYGQTVIQRMEPGIQADHAYSLVNDFPDAWYDLHNPQLSEEPQQMVVRFEILRADFSPNLERIQTRNIALSFDRKDGLRSELHVERLQQLDAAGNLAPGDFSAETIDGVVSTRRGNGANWMPLVGGAAGSGGKSPFGIWELSLRNPDPAQRLQLKEWLDQDLIRDILLVFSYKAELPEWPQ